MNRIQNGPQVQVHWNGVINPSELKVEAGGYFGIERLWLWLCAHLPRHAAIRWLNAAIGSVLCIFGVSCESVRDRVVRNASKFLPRPFDTHSWRGRDNLNDLFPRREQAR
jgi:hypothetical protein